MATIRDVARVAGVSPATVSFVLNGTKPVNDETEARVRKAMRELDYSPNAFARGLATRQTRMLAMIYPSGEDGSIGDINNTLAGAVAAARKYGYTVFLWPVSQTENVAELLNSGLADGVILTRVYLADPRVEVVRASTTPFVMIGRTESNEAMDFVDIDFEGASRGVVRRLHDLGHRNVVFVAAHDLGARGGDRYGPTHRSTTAFLAAASELQMDAKVILSADSESEGRAVLAQEFSVSDMPTAFVCATVRAAFGVLHESRRLGLEVPRDLTVLLYNSPPHMAELAEPGLAEYLSPAAQLGETAVEMLVSRLRGRAQGPQQILVPCTYRHDYSLGQARQV